MLKIGELAKLAAVTVRTLHHYDHLGLVSPSRRSQKGYRLYTAGDVGRLQMVRAMQELGFSLQEIQNMVRQKKFSFKKIIGMQLEGLQKKIQLEQSLYERLVELERLLADRREVPLEDVLFILQIMDNVKQFNLNPDEEEQLKKHWAQYSPEDIKAVEAEWPKLIAEARAHMEKGTDPKDPAMQKIAKRWMELVSMFTGGNQKMAEQAKKNIEENNDTLRAKHGDGVPDRALLDYVQKALR